MKISKQRLHQIIREETQHLIKEHVEPEWREHLEKKFENLLQDFWVDEGFWAKWKSMNEKQRNKNYDIIIDALRTVIDKTAKTWIREDL
jgi:hypothetical protein